MANKDRHDSCHLSVVMVLLFIMQLTRKAMAQVGSASPMPKELAQLRDIHLPTPITWWPLAPGWYLLLAISTIVMVSTILFFYRRYQANRPKRLALHLLKMYQQAYQQHPDPLLASRRINELLKRVALAYFSRHVVASLYGEAWLAFLNAHTKKLNFEAVREALLELPYHAQPDNVQNQLPILFSLAKSWIMEQHKSCSN